MQEVEAPARASIIVVSDFVCPWCYVGLQEIDRIRQEFEVDVEFAPYLLDPSVPPEGRHREPYTKPGEPPTQLEQRGATLGIDFKRGRTFHANSHLSLEAAEFATEHGRTWEFRRALFKAYFEDLANIGDIDTLVALGESAGLDGPALREALTDRRYRDLVDEGIEWSRAIGVTGVPTFVINEQYGVVGAQEYPVLVNVMEQLGVPRREQPAG